MTEVKEDEGTLLVRTQEFLQDQSMDRFPSRRHMGVNPCSPLADKENDLPPSPLAVRNPDPPPLSLNSAGRRRLYLVAPLVTVRTPGARLSS